VGVDVLLSGKYSDIIFVVDVKLILRVLYEKSFVVLNYIYIYYWEENKYVTTLMMEERNVGIKSTKKM
jgi:hypothetical protein